MINRLRTIVVMLLLGIFLGACNSSKKLAVDNSVDYQSAKQLPNIIIPESVVESSDDTEQTPNKQ